MECLTRKSALYVCNDSYRWVDAAVELLRKEIVFEHDIDAFCARLRADLQTGAALKPRRDDSVFLRRYGNPFADDATAVRVADAIAKVAGARR
jgi:predicted HD phosphohydrolase